ncbi:hypothetical protein BpOF4_06025 [Alkalihalophilus pseudofirmus OF4]|uniref:Uncharacterized protein n=1 Tax=Alkalihalophilus pseudofirmus (strain ATCC BAA-2126 / JCM 17055 / OF4) TaxID=398511 RepID=D3FZM5_ALKPO|nr:hypothetical protein [Alkalihalophilus pseudofirmus]ADC49267.1 hypothetical protein BpOF4_06025 [Alkalihalophilus pseudofirmus OF4]
MPYSYDVKIDFYNDWIQHLKRSLISLGYEPPESPKEISFQYFNFLRRIVPPIPRKVLLSREFTFRNDMREGLELIIEKVEKGIDLGPHLSSNIFDVEYNDDLLNDWGIYHLHLGTKIRKKDGLIERTGPLLFVRFDNQFAYFINIMNHGSWTNQDMVRIIHKNWPSSIKSFRLKEISGVHPRLTNKDIYKLRRGGANSVIEIEDGVVYAP